MAIENPFEMGMISRVDARRRRQKQRAEVGAVLNGPVVRPAVPMPAVPARPPQAFPAARTARVILRALGERAGLVAASTRASGSSTRNIVSRPRKF